MKNIRDGLIEIDGKFYSVAAIKQRVLPEEFWFDERPMQGQRLSFTQGGEVFEYLVRRLVCNGKDCFVLLNPKSLMFWNSEVMESSPTISLKDLVGTAFLDDFKLIEY